MRRIVCCGLILACCLGLTARAAEQASAEAIQIVLDILKGQDEEMKAVAIAMVKEMPGKEVTEALAKELPNLSPTGQVQLLSALGDRGDATALPAVVAAVKSSDESVRIAALKAIGQLGDASVVMLLAEKAATSTGEEQKAARESLYRLRGAEVDKAILAGVSKADAKAKVELVSAIGQRNIREGIDVLMQTAKDPDRRVRTESFQVLKGLCGPEHLPALVELLITAKSSSDRTEAEKTVVAVAHKMGQKRGQAKTVLDALPRVTENAVRASLLSVLGRIGDESALDVLRKELSSENAELRTAAIRALSNWPSPEPLMDLLKIARSSDNQLHRILALRGFVQLLGLPSDRPAEKTIALYREALALAPNAFEKKRVLAGLAGTASLGALQMAQEFLDDSALRMEAEVAVVRIAGSIYGSYPQQVKEVLAALVGSARSDSIRQQGRQILEQIKRLEDFVTAWQVAGPYSQAGADGTKLFDVAFEPEKDPKSCHWRVVPVGTNPARPWLVELDKFIGGDNRVAYLRSEIWSEKAQEAVLEIGSDDGIKVWLNGQLVHANNATRPVSPGQDKVKVSLRQGWNKLVVKLTQSGGEWALCVRLRKADGSKIEGLRFRPGS